MPKDQKGAEWIAAELERAVSSGHDGDPGSAVRRLEGLLNTAETELGQEHSDVIEPFPPGRVTWLITA